MAMSAPALHWFPMLAMPAGSGLQVTHFKEASGATSRTLTAFGWNMFKRGVPFVAGVGGLLTLPAIVVASALRYFGTLVRVENQSGTQPVHFGFFYDAMLRAGGGRMRELAAQVWPAANATSTLWGFLLVEACVIAIMHGLLLAVGLRRGLYVFQGGFRLRRSGFARSGSVEAAWRISKQSLLPLSALLGILSAVSIWLFFPMTLANWPNLAGQLALTTTALLTLGPFILGLTCRIPYDGTLGHQNQSLTCLQCGYVLGGSVTPPCPECGQRLPAAASMRPPHRRKRPLLRWVTKCSLIAIGVGVAVPYFFDELRHLRPHLLLQSDWNRKYGEVYERQLHQGFEGVSGERNLFTQPDACLRIRFRDADEFCELVACVLYVDDPESTAAPLPSEQGASKLIIITRSQVLGDSGDPIAAPSGSMNVYLFDESNPQRRAPVWRSPRVALWNMAVRSPGLLNWQPLRQWYLARAEDVSIFPMDASEEQKLLDDANSKIKEILASNFSPSAKVYRPARPAS